MSEHCHCHDEEHLHYDHSCEEQSKYEFVINEYADIPTDEEIAKAIKRAGEKVEKNKNKEVLKEIY